MSKTRVNLLMQEELLHELEDAAGRDGRAVADIIREACREWVYRDKRKGISKFFDKKCTDGEDNVELGGCNE